MTHELTLFSISCHKYMQLLIVLVKGVLLLRHSSKSSILIQQSKDLIKAVTRIYFILFFYFVSNFSLKFRGCLNTQNTPLVTALSVIKAISCHLGWMNRRRFCLQKGGSQKFCLINIMFCFNEFAFTVQVKTQNK